MSFPGFGNSHRGQFQRKSDDEGEVGFEGLDIGAERFLNTILGRLTIMIG